MARQKLGGLRRRARAAPVLRDCRQRTGHQRGRQVCTCACAHTVHAMITCPPTACSIDSVMFNAVLCALLHAGVPLRRCFVSVTVALCEGTWVIDPITSEQVRMHPVVLPRFAAQQCRIADARTRCGEPLTLRTRSAAAAAA